MKKSTIGLQPRRRTRVVVAAQVEDLVEDTVAISAAHEEPPVVDAPSLALMKDTDQFTYEHFSQLSLNENYRYYPNSSRVAHAVISRDADGTLMASQYDLPAGTDPETPVVCQISDIKEIEVGGMIRHQATGSDGTKWYAKRYDRAQIQLEHQDLTSIDVAYFSEEDESNRYVFWGSHAEIPRLRADRVDESQRGLATPKRVKGGHEMEVDPRSVFLRETDRSKGRGISQNKLMAGAKKEKSARDAYEEFFQQMESKLSPEMIKILKRAFSANIKNPRENQYRPEWLHAYGFALTPLSQNPQHKGNLGAAGKWANTEMMVLERIAKWFALHQNTSTRITVKTLFEMLDESELIDKIHFEVSIEFHTRFIRFIQDLDALKEAPVFRKASDLAQATGIGYSILHSQTPIRREKITSLCEATAALTVVEPKTYRLVPTSLIPRESRESTQYIATIIDLETTGLDRAKDKIIEIGILSFSFTINEGVLAVIDSYGGLQDPGIEISAEVTRVTHLTSDDVRGKSIDWSYVHSMLDKSDVVFCHNSDFDRKFLERDTPDYIREKVCTLSFGCTMQDINWQAKGYKSRRLESLNAQLGFEYPGHRAINDCWATLNLLREVDGSIAELMANVGQNKTLLCAVDTEYVLRKQLKLNHFKWSDGVEKNLPQGWYIYVSDEELADVKKWLDETIYSVKGRSDVIPQLRGLSARERYSVREEFPKHVPLKGNRFFQESSASSTSRIASANVEPMSETPVTSRDKKRLQTAAMDDTVQIKHQRL